jgi:hypothetical protein
MKPKMEQRKEGCSLENHDARNVLDKGCRTSIVPWGVANERCAYAKSIH